MVLTNEKSFSNEVELAELILFCAISVSAMVMAYLSCCLKNLRSAFSIF